MFTDLADFLTQLLSAFRTVFRIGGVPAGEIEQQPDHTKMNFGAVIVATILYYIVCSVYYVFTRSSVSLFGSTIVATIFILSSIFVIFFVSLVVTLFDGGKDADLRSDLWATLLTNVWIVSLIVFGLDLLIAMSLGRPPASIIVASNVPKLHPESLETVDVRRQIVIAAFYTLIAIIVVGLRSKVILKAAVGRGFIGGLVVALVFNFIFFYLMVFWVPTLAATGASVAAKGALTIGH